MSLSPREVNASAVDWKMSEEAELIDAHLLARTAQRRVLMQCSLVGIVGVMILLAIILGHVPEGASGMVNN